MGRNMEEFRRQLDMLFDQSKDELKEVRPHVVVHCSPRRSLCVMPSCRPRADLVPLAGSSRDRSNGVHDAVPGRRERSREHCQRSQRERHAIRGVMIATSPPPQELFVIK